MRRWILRNKFSHDFNTFFNDVADDIATAVHAAIAGTGAEQTITTGITHPDVPRNATITTTNVAAPSGNVLIYGWTALGIYTSESLAIIAGSLRAGWTPFVTIDTIVIPAGVTAADTVSVGIGQRLGLTKYIQATTDVIKVVKNGTSISYTAYLDNVVAVGALTAGDDFVIYYYDNWNSGAY